MLFYVIALFQANSFHLWTRIITAPSNSNQLKRILKDFSHQILLKIVTAKSPKEFEGKNKIPSELHTF